MPANFRIMFGEDDGKTKDVVFAYAVKIPQNGRGVITNEDIDSARLDFDEISQKFCVMLAMTPAGRVKWSNMTQKCINHFIAVTLDDVIYSCPRVLGKISGGRTEISGNFTAQEAKGLAAVLQNGRLALPLKIVQMDVVPAK